MGTFRGVELADLTLSGERLDLRRWRAEDAARVHDVMQDRAMSDFLALPNPYTPDVAADFVERIGHEGRDAGTGLGSALVDRATGRVVGACALRLGSDPDIGYWVAPDARGHRYATEATRVLADWAFRVGVRRVELRCDVRNLASVRTAMAAGFAFEAVSREACRGSSMPDGRPADLARFARLAADTGAAVAPAFPPLPPDGLSDGVLRLRPTGPDDAAGFAAGDDVESLRWSFYGAHRAPAEVQRTTAQAGLDWLVGRTARCTLLDVATGRFAGDLQVRFEGPPGVAGVGYTVHPAFRGRGYTARALRLIVPWCFDAAGFARIELGAKRGNIASQRAAASAGFSPDGVRARRLRNADGTFADEVCFVLLNPASADSA